MEYNCNHSKINYLKHFPQIRFQSNITQKISYENQINDKKIK